MTRPPGREGLSITSTGASRLGGLWASLFFLGLLCGNEILPLGLAAIALRNLAFAPFYSSHGHVAVAKEFPFSVANFKPNAAGFDLHFNLKFLDFHLHHTPPNVHSPYSSRALAAGGVKGVKFNLRHKVKSRVSDAAN
jgi:hypothetical protein